MIERIAWAPSLGIEYHLGVDALGALMLVLSAIVTLMSVMPRIVSISSRALFRAGADAESGLFGSFTALNFFHWFLFWELSLIPAFFLIKLWGGARARAGGDAVLCLHHGGSGGVAVVVSRGLPVDRHAWTLASLPPALQTGTLEKRSHAHLGR